MIVGDLSTLADQLRRNGFEARNLAQVGITIWKGGQGFFISAEQLRDVRCDFTPLDVHQLLEDKRNNGNMR